MNLDEWVAEEENRIVEMYANGDIDSKEQSRLLKELYREARDYEEEDLNNYMDNYPGMGNW